MLNRLQSEWEDTPEYHSFVKEQFDKNVNADKELKDLRDWVEQNAFGFGERCFYHMWDLMVQEMPNNFVFGEIGIFRGQTLALIEILAKKHLKECERHGVSPLDSSDGHWESDYKKDIKTIHDTFGLQENYCILQYSSTSEEAIERMAEIEFDIMYIDGGHEYETVVSDLKHYPLNVKVGGFLVVDDACCEMSQPWGFFQGIEPVTRATLEWFEANKENWEFVFNVVHLRIYRKIR